MECTGETWHTRARIHVQEIVPGLSERELAILRDHYREVYLSNAANVFRAVGIRLASCIPTSNVQWTVNPKGYLRLPSKYVIYLRNLVNILARFANHKDPITLCQELIDFFSIGLGSPSTLFRSSLFSERSSSRALVEEERRIYRRSTVAPTNLSYVHERFIAIFRLSTVDHWEKKLYPIPNWFEGRPRRTRPFCQRD